MNAAAEAIRNEVLAGYEGMEDDVLLETPLSETLFTGYTRLYVPVVVSAPGHASGEIVRVRLGSLRRRAGAGRAGLSDGFRSG